MHIQVITTVNLNKYLLDRTLLRKGRLTADYAFDKLVPAKANNLLIHLGIDFRTDQPMTLADIFNLDEQTVSGERHEVKLGF